MSDRARNGRGAEESELADVIRYMHDVAGKYHLHFSTVRTASNSLIVPIGLTASVILIEKIDQIGPLFPILFVAFVVLIALALNLTFASWSHAALKIERYYERMLAEQEYLRHAQFDPRQHGFRHLFHRVTGGSQEPVAPPGAQIGNDVTNPADPDGAVLSPTPNWMSTRALSADFLRAHLRNSFLREPFVRLTWVGGVLYLVLYIVTILWLTPSSGNAGTRPDTTSRLTAAEREIRMVRSDLDRLNENYVALRDERDRAVAVIQTIAADLHGLEAQLAEARGLLAAGERPGR